MPWISQRLANLTVAWNRRAEEHQRTWEYRWRPEPAPACA